MLIQYSESRYLWRSFRELVYIQNKIYSPFNKAKTSNKMNFGDFHGFSAAFERAGLTKDEISELTDAALNRYKLRVSRGFKI